MTEIYSQPSTALCIIEGMKTNNTREIKTLRKSKQLPDEVKGHMFLIFIFLEYDIRNLFNICLLKELSCENYVTTHILFYFCSVCWFLRVPDYFCSKVRKKFCFAFTQISFQLFLRNVLILPCLSMKFHLPFSKYVT